MRLRGSFVALAAAALVTLCACHDDAPGTKIGNRQATASAATGGAARFTSYLALGDSYTAAPGVPQTETDTGCLRSNGNYPALLAARLAIPYVDVSCSEATALSMVGVQRVQDHTLPAQFDALDPSTSLVTVGIGIGDLSLFSLLINSCSSLAPADPHHHPCRDYMHQYMVTAAAKHHQVADKHADLLLSKIHEIEGRVTAVVKGIHNRAPQATVVLVGYPQLVPATGHCKILPLATGDYPYARMILERLDQALAQSAKRGKATYVDVLEASQGHDICAGPDAWVNGDTPDVARALAYHPFASEQQAVADLIAEQLGVG